MDRKVTLRALLAASVLGIAAAANAQISVILVSNGMATLGAGNTVNFAETVDYQAGGLGTVTSDSYSIGNNSFAGTGTYTGPGGSFSFDVNLNPSTEVMVGSNESIDGTWTFTSGTGGYANVVSGGGTIAVDLLLVGPGAISGTALSGDFVATPEPASYLAMGIGVAGLLIRRRRKA